VRSVNDDFEREFWPARTSTICFNDAAKRSNGAPLERILPPACASS